MPTVNVSNDIQACKYSIPTLLKCHPEDTNEITRFSPAPIYFRKATVLARKADGGSNTGDVKVGFDPSNESNLPYTLSPGDEVVLEAPLGSKWNFFDWVMVMYNEGDGVIAIYS